MPEGFDVKPHWVSGYGELMGAEQSTIAEISDYVWGKGYPRGSWTGLLSVLEKPVETYVNSVLARLGERSRTVGETSTELGRVAWEYLGKEKENTEKFEGGLKVEDDPAAEKYPTSSPELAEPDVDPDVNPFEAMTEGFRSKFTGEVYNGPVGNYEVIFDIGFPLHAIDWFFQTHGRFDYSPYESIIKPLIGNWDSLKYTGEILINAGTACEDVATSITDGLVTLDLHWDGGAAQACAAYVSRLAEALDLEGPLNRTVGDVLVLIADQVSQAIGEINARLKFPTKNLGETLGYIGSCHITETTEEMIDTAMKLVEHFRAIYDSAKLLVETVSSVIDWAETFTETVSNLEDLDSIDDNEFEDLTDRVLDTMERHDGGAAEGVAADVADLADLADVSVIADAPTEGYQAGDAERDGD